MDAIGGEFLPKKCTERLFQDVQASGFHPLPSGEQYAFTGADNGKILSSVPVRCVFLWKNTYCQCYRYNMN